MFNQTFNEIQIRFRKGTFIRNVLTLMTGTAISQIIPVAMSPIFTRLYTPTDFGTFALFVSLSTAISVVATGRYELAVMLPKRDEDAFNLVALCFSIALSLSLVALVPFSIFNQAIANLFRNQKLSGWLYFISLTIFFTGSYQTLNYWSNRKKQYKRMAISRILQSSIMAIVSFIMGILKSGTSGLIIGGISGQGVAAATLAWQNWKEDKNKLHFISRNVIKHQANRYIDFPKINSVHAFLDMLQLNGIVFIISAFFGSTILGYYTLTMRVLKTPLNFIGKSIAQVFYQKASETYNTGGELQVVVKKTIIRLAVIAFPIFATLLLAAPFLFTFIFGNDWREAGVYTQILSPWLFVNFVYSPVSQIPLLVNQQKKNLIIGFVYNLLVLTFIVVGYYLKNIKTGFYLLSLFMSIYLVFTLYWLFRISKQKPLNLKTGDEYKNEI